MDEMNVRPRDFELLQSFVRQGEQTAFADLVRRHVDLVFGTALRKVGDAGAAQEVAQNVFVALARKAWRFAPDDSLPAWLHKTALLESKAWLRGELRRRRREETATQLGTTMRTPEDQPAFQALLPFLDEALLSLREKDRDALLLRFYENRPLRDVGSAFGVDEDAAQKRVQRALEKLAQFFHRRGFRTATLAATTAALKATAASTPPAAASAVVSAALQSAPPAATGLMALLSRVAALSKPQAAALCLVVVAVPVGWQWQRASQVEQAAGASHAQVETTRAQLEETAADVQRLQTEATRLASAGLSAAQTQLQQQAAVQKIESLKARGRSLMADSDYRWPDDLPFVRVPKSALPSITMADGPNTPAVLQTKINQLLELTPVEQESVNQVFTNYFAGLDQLLQTSLYQTNHPAKVQLPSGAESAVFVLEAMGPKIRDAMDQLRANLASVLGQDRWVMIRPDQFEFEHYEQVRLLGYTRYAWDQTQEIAVNIFPNPGGDATVNWTDGQLGSSTTPLHLFLNKGANPFSGWQGPPALEKRIMQWLVAQAAARAANPAQK